MHTCIHAYIHTHIHMPARQCGWTSVSRIQSEGQTIPQTQPVGHTDTASGSVSTLQPHRRTLKDSTNKLKVLMTVMHDGDSDNDRDDRNNDGGGDEKDDDSNEDDGDYEHHDDDADDDRKYI